MLFTWSQFILGDISNEASNMTILSSDVVIFTDVRWCDQALLKIEKSNDHPCFRINGVISVIFLKQHMPFKPDSGFAVQRHEGKTFEKFSTNTRKKQVPEIYKVPEGSSLKSQVIKLLEQNKAKMSPVFHQHRMSKQWWHICFPFEMKYRNENVFLAFRGCTEAAVAQTAMKHTETQTKCVSIMEKEEKHWNK